MKRALSIFALFLPLSVLADDGAVVEAIPNEFGGLATLYDGHDDRCKGSNFAAQATNGDGQVTGKGCWQYYDDGYLIFVTEGEGSGEMIHITHEWISLRLGHVALRMETDHTVARARSHEVSRDLEMP